jgi:hypothetical protein
MSTFTTLILTLYYTFHSGCSSSDEATGEQSLVCWVSWDDSFLCSLCFPIASLKDNSLHQRFVGVDMVSSH